MSRRCTVCACACTALRRRRHHVLGLGGADGGVPLQGAQRRGHVDGHAPAGQHAAERVGRWGGQRLDLSSPRMDRAADALCCRSRCLAKCTDAARTGRSHGSMDAWMLESERPRSCQCVCGAQRTTGCITSRSEGAFDPMPRCIQRCLLCTGRQAGRRGCSCRGRIVPSVHVRVLHIHCYNQPCMVRYLAFSWIMQDLKSHCACCKAAGIHPNFTIARL